MHNRCIMDGMPHEMEGFRNEGRPTGQEQEIQNKLGRVQARTLNLDAGEKDRKELSRSAFAFIGRDYLSSRPTLVVAAPWLHTTSDAQFDKARARLERMGESALQNAIGMGLVSHDDRDRIKIEIVAPRHGSSQGNLAMPSRIQGNEQLVTRQIKKNVDTYTQSTNEWRIPAKIMKKATSVVSVGLLTLTACAAVPVSATTLNVPTETITATATEAAKVYRGTLEPATQATIDNYWKVATESGKLKEQIAKGLTEKDIVGFKAKLTNGTVSKDANFTYFVDPVTGEERLITQTGPNGWTELQKVKDTPANVVIWAAGTEAVFEYQYTTPGNPNSGLTARFHEASIYGKDLLPNHASNLAIKISPSRVSPGGLLIKRSLERNQTAQFNVVTIDQAGNKEASATCKYEALFDGTYKNWLESLPPTEFDPNNMVDVPLVLQDNGRVMPSIKNAPHWEGANQGKKPFNRDRGFCYTTYKGNEYIVMPVEYYDKAHPDKNQWVITVKNITGKSAAEIQKSISIWKNDMNITLWFNSATDMYSSTPDPLIELTLSKHPDLAQLVDKFVDISPTRNDGKGDRTALDVDGIVVINVIGSNDGGWFE